MRHHGACGFCIGRLRRDSAWTRRLLSSFCANLMLLLKLLPIVFAPSRRTPPRRLRRHGTLVVCVCVVCAISAHSSSDVASSAPLRHHGALLRVVCAITAQVHVVCFCRLRRHGALESPFAGIVHLFGVLTRCSFSNFSQLILRHHGTSARPLALRHHGALIKILLSAPSRHNLHPFAPSRHYLAPRSCPRACLQDPERNAGFGT